jgi:hypothetical protein
VCVCVCVFVVRTHLVGQGLLCIEVALSRLDTPQSIGLLWTSDRSNAETPDNRQFSQETDIRVPGGIRTRKSNKLAAADRPLDLTATGIGELLFEV